ncbi:hypothetical protein tb265_36720 [Gemmatimonadetes bacterium T265]|nr:hypothetical protein tb265_36720 [Gemmatimonadetes bacterium T265]
MNGGRATGRAASELGAVLRAFRAAVGCRAALWAAPSSGAPARLLAHDGDPAGLRWPDPHGPPTGARLATVPGLPSTWLTVGPCADGSAPSQAQLDLLAPLVARQLQTAGEVEQAALELSERYEEINLLYTITEILGRAVTLEETARVILTEVSETVGARRGAIYLYEPGAGVLRATATLGVPAAGVPPVAVDAADSTAARVFRTLHPTIDERDGPGADGTSPDGALRDGALLCVPIVWSGPSGGEPLGVVALSGRRAGQQFTAGDLKLVTAIASQIAAAIQNARLVRASIQQQRLTQEMALAHDLQMSLLPRVDVVAPAARVAARVVPADSVGGDFYQLVRLPGARTGVMVGDVSSHGYRAALIMALTMSAAAIHAQQSGDPGETLGAVLGSLGDELATTEMFISTVYAVVDPRAGTLLYANAGHPHAFVLRADGSAERLPAGAPPLGLVPATPACARTTWHAGEDLLVVFTDGISEAVDANGRMLGEEPVLAAARAVRDRDPDAVVAAVFDALAAHTGGAAPRDDLTLVVARS